MKKLKRILPFVMALTLAAVSIPLTARADNSKVVTLGANLSDDQRASMYKYFGTTADEVETIEVNNADERKYMEGIATEEQIGTRTFSCAYVEPTGSGGIQVKTANLTFVTSTMIASTLLTSGVENCNVVAASPIEVSGTGALTGIMMAYESASGETLNEEQKAAAVEELVTTGDLADSVGQQPAADLMNDVKEEVIEGNLSDEGEIRDAVNDAAEDLGITVTDDQMAKIVALMQKISQYDYDVNALKDTLDNLEGKSKGFFSGLIDSIKSFFSGGNSEGGIINDTDDSILGDSAVIDSTLDAIKGKVDDAAGEGFFDRIINFFKNLFEGDDTDDDTDTANGDAAPAETGTSGDADASNGDAAPAETDAADDGGLTDEDMNNVTTETFDTSDGELE